jgi:predicted NBD/HSP70 family sugar kinase
MRVLPVSRTANANLQNKINISVIFNYLRDNGPSYRAKISKDLRISAPAVSRAVENLISKNYVIETERVQTESGKKAAYLTVNAAHGYVFGVDLIKKHIRIAVADFNGTILKKFSGPVFNDKMDVTAMLLHEIEKAKALYDSSSPESCPSELKAICIGVPATIDVETGSTTIAALIETLKGSEVKKALSEKYGVPVFIENITKLSALGEKRFGAGRAHHDIVFFEVSTGIGAGIIIQNNLHRGSGGAAGEVGFSIIGTENISYPLSHTGFFERFASVDSIAEKAVKRLQSGERSIVSECPRERGYHGRSGLQRCIGR